jgi:hypothetical protein
MNDQASLSDYLAAARQWAERRQLGSLVPAGAVVLALGFGALLWFFFRIAFGLVLGRFW